jgi:hypothetical protein
MSLHNLDALNSSGLKRNRMLPKVNERLYNMADDTKCSLVLLKCQIKTLKKC